MTRDLTLGEAIAEAIAAFDAGNHAWGRFYHYVVRRAPAGVGVPPVAPVRQALQEAALSVPRHGECEEARQFSAAIGLARQVVEVFVADLPSEQRTGDILLVAEAFREALDALEPWVADCHG